MELIINTATSVLYHELAHANDYVSSENFPKLNQNKTLYDQSLEIVSDKMVAKFGLLSEPTINHLTQVIIKGVEATPEDMAITPQTFSAILENSNGISFYSFLNSHEELAMNTEALLRECLHKTKSIEAIITNDQAEVINNTVIWRGFSRVFKPEIKERALFALKAILPNLNLDDCEPEGNESYLTDFPTNVSLRVFLQKQ